MVPPWVKLPEVINGLRKPVSLSKLDFKMLSCYRLHMAIKGEMPRIPASFNHTQHQI